MCLKICSIVHIVRTKYWQMPTDHCERRCQYLYTSTLYKKTQDTELMVAFLICGTLYLQHSSVWPTYTSPGLTFLTPRLIFISIYGLSIGLGSFSKHKPLLNFSFYNSHSRLPVSSPKQNSYFPASYHLLGPGICHFLPTSSLPLVVCDYTLSTRVLVQRDVAPRWLFWTCSHPLLPPPTSYCVQNKIQTPGDDVRTLTPVSMYVYFSRLDFYSFFPIPSASQPPPCSIAETTQ